MVIGSGCRLVLECERLLFSCGGGLGVGVVGEGEIVEGCISSFGFTFVIQIIIIVVIIIVIIIVVIIVVVIVRVIVNGIMVVKYYILVSFFDLVSLLQLLFVINWP
jgi:hypothetical protein